MSGQRCWTVSACKAFTMPWIIFICYTTRCDNLKLKRINEIKLPFTRKMKHLNRCSFGFHIPNWFIFLMGKKTPAKLHTKVGICFVHILHSIFIWQYIINFMRFLNSVSSRCHFENLHLEWIKKTHRVEQVSKRIFFSINLNAMHGIAIKNIYCIFCVVYVCVFRKYKYICVYANWKWYDMQVCPRWETKAKLKTDINLYRKRFANQLLSTLFQSHRLAINLSYLLNFM